MVRTITSSPKKRKAYRPKRRITELVPKDSPWNQTDWWNEKSGKCRPIVEALRKGLEAAVEVFVFHDTTNANKVPIGQSPKSVLDPIPNDPEEKVIHFDRGYVRYLEDEGHAKGVWGVFHLSWGKLLASRTAASPWRVKPADDGPKDIDPKALKYAIRKPPGLWQDELNSCVAMLRYEDEGEASLPLKAVAQHLKIADLQHVLIKARNIVKARKGEKLNSLKVEVSNGQTVDLAPILQVIVDDEFGQVYVEDAVEILDAMVGFAGSFKCPEQAGWTMEHEKCGDLIQLFEGWEDSNKLTAQAFVLLCLHETAPEDKSSERTAVRNGSTTTRKRGKRTLAMIHNRGRLS
ncbi:hypothetical protein ACA910_019659 [Epithemia clementina (nom. ined.)]